MAKRRKKKLSKLRRYFFAGILVLAPVGLTFWVLRFLVRTADSLLTIEHDRFFYVVPSQFHPDILLGFHVPGLGIVLSLFVILLVGLITSNVLGKQLLKLIEDLVHRVPFVNSIYKAFKQLFGTVFEEGSRNFREVVLVEFPQKGQFTIGFITGDAFAAAQKNFKVKMLNIFIPHTPLPSTGFFLIIPESEVIRLDISTEEAFKIILSFGIITPESNPKLPEKKSTRTGKAGNATAD
jgi:uncharacterized membrane protein